LHFADASLDSISPVIPANRRHEIPLALTSGFTEAVIALARRLKADVLIPTVDEELPLLADAFSDLQDIVLMLPSFKFVTAMLDKLICMETLKKLGIPAPATVTLAKAADIGLPCFAKPRQGRGSRGIFVLRRAEQLAALPVLTDQLPEDILIQPLLEGDEFTVMMAADRAGNLRAVVPVLVKRKRGVTLRGATVKDEQVIAFCQHLHQTLRPNGCYNIQLMKLLNGAIMPFEINPRISTTFCLGVAAGIDPVDIYLGDCVNETTLAPFQEGMELRRYWQNVMV
jgi:carbamoyl-phosphate synthase large subunit